MQLPISVSPEVLGATPVFSGTRVPVQTLLDYLEAGDSIDDFLDGFPSVGREQVLPFLEMAKAHQIRFVRLLLDECVDRRLARDVVGHDITTVIASAGRVLAACMVHGRTSSSEGVGAEPRAVFM